MCGAGQGWGGAGREGKGWAGTGGEGVGRVDYPR